MLLVSLLITCAVSRLRDRLKGLLAGINPSDECDDPVLRLQE